MYTPVYGNSALHQHSKDTLLPLRQGKGGFMWDVIVHPCHNLVNSLTPESYGSSFKSVQCCGLSQ